MKTEGWKVKVCCVLSVRLDRRGESVKEHHTPNENRRKSSRCTDAWAKENIYV